MKKKLEKISKFNEIIKLCYEAMYELKDEIMFPEMVIIDRDNNIEEINKGFSPENAPYKARAIFEFLRRDCNWKIYDEVLKLLMEYERGTERRMPR